MADSTRILYIFPHPDDESFGPAGIMHKQIQEGHEVFLLTLTKGGATRQRFKLGLTVEEMGEVRYKEMLKVEQTIGLTGMTVLDLPDSGLSEMDPREIEQVIQEHIEKIQPHIVVSYPVHGISGFHDHLIMHAVIKRLFLEMKDNGADYLKRLAFFTLRDSGKPSMIDGRFRLRQSEPELIDCVVHFDEENREILRQSLLCYDTYQDIIAKTGVFERIGTQGSFEIFGENYDPPLSDLTEGL